ncbi:predicted protein [Streptomyces sp. F-3]|nr:predicted protein [Streptomyces sp. F-3]
MAVEPRLGHHHADRTGCHTHHCLHEATSSIRPSIRTDTYRTRRTDAPHHTVRGSERTLSPASRNRQFHGAERGGNHTVRHPLRLCEQGKPARGEPQCGRRPLAPQALHRGGAAGRQRQEGHPGRVRHGGARFAPSAAPAETAHEGTWGTEPSSGVPTGGRP